MYGAISNPKPKNRQKCIALEWLMKHSKMF